jgi:hypothetical protein
MSEKVENPVYQQPCQFLGEGISLRLCLFGRPVDGYGDIAYNLVVIRWEGEDIGRSIIVKILPVELPYFGVIGK